MKPDIKQLALIDDDTAFAPIEVARVLGVTPQCVTTWIRKKSIKSTKVGGRYYIAGSEIKKKVQANDVKEAANGEAAL